MLQVIVVKEIGGYIELDRHFGSLYHDHAVALNCGRAGLEYLIRAKKIKKVYLPYFCCHSVTQPCQQCGIEFEYYHIGEDFFPKVNFTLDENEWLYIVNYYGQIDNRTVMQYKERFGNVILDNAQAYFQPPIEGVDTIYTSRKFLGVSDGAFVYTDKRIDIPARDESYSRVEYLLGRFERSASEFFAESQKNNERFDQERVKRMSKLTENLLRGIDYERVKNQRSRNFSYLHRHIEKENLLNLHEVSGAFMYPFMIEDAPRLRRKLIENKIYVPVLWPNVVSEMPCDTLEFRYSSTILPIPCDQRYDEEDMQYIINLIKRLR